MKSLIKTLAVYCFALPLAFHLLAYIMLGGGRFKEDLEVFKSRRGITKSNIYAFLYLLMMYPEFRSVFYWRLGKWARFVFFYFPGRTNLVLYTSPKNVEGGFYVGHGWSTVVNAERIGKNFVIGQNSTVGGRNGKSPIIGDDVSCWAHSVVLGDITIGNGSQIGSGSVVVKSLPANSVVVPQKSMIIKQNGERVNIPL